MYMYSMFSPKLDELLSFIVGPGNRHLYYANSNAMRGSGVANQSYATPASSNSKATTVYTTIGSIQTDSIQVPQVKMVPLDSK